MTAQPQRRLAMHWTAPKNLLAILLFILVTIVLQYFIVALTMSTGTNDQTTTPIPGTQFSFSLLYHVLPVAVTTALTASFVLLTGQAAKTSQKPQAIKKLPISQAATKPTRLKVLRRFSRNVNRATSRIKQKVLQWSPIARFRRRMAPAQSILRSAIVIAAAFTTLIILVAVAAYPNIVPETTVGLYTRSTAFHGFVMATIHFSQSVAEAIPPVGVAAAALNNAFLAASPAFRGTLEGAASSLTAGFVASSPVDKYLVIQNVAAWTTAMATLLYRWYSRTFGRRW